MKIFRYPLTAGMNDVSMPDGKILKFGLDPSGSPSVWALVEPDQLPYIKKIYLATTGEDLDHIYPPQLYALPRERAYEQYLGSCVTADSFVWHAFLVRP